MNKEIKRALTAVIEGDDPIAYAWRCGVRLAAEMMRDHNPDEAARLLQAVDEEDRRAIGD